jgi:undecaprenyl-diphosphatase
VNVLDAIILGAVQGVTEFLPISSDGHLRLAHAWLGEPEGSLVFDVFLHVGTLIAVFTVFGRKLVELVADAVSALPAFVRAPRATLAEREGLRAGLIIGLATIPTGIIGLLLKDHVGGDTFSVTAVGWLIIVNGFILYSVRVLPTLPPSTQGWVGIGWAKAIALGVAEGIAVLPGVSRSGLTITSGLMMGADRERVAELSFLMAIPAILGASILEIDFAELSAMGGGMTPALVGLVTSALVGIVALHGLVVVLRRAQFHHFAWYCWALGALVVGLGAAGVIS